MNLRLPTLKRGRDGRKSGLHVLQTSKTPKIDPKCASSPFPSPIFRVFRDFRSFSPFLALFGPPKPQNQPRMNTDRHGLRFSDLGPPTSDFGPPLRPRCVPFSVNNGRFGGIWDHLEALIRSPTGSEHQNPVLSCPLSHFSQIFYRQLKPMRTTMSMRVLRFAITIGWHHFLFP